MRTLSSLVPFAFRGNSHWSLFKYQISYYWTTWRKIIGAGFRTFMCPSFDSKLPIGADKIRLQQNIITARIYVQCTVIYSGASFWLENKVILCGYSEPILWSRHQAILHSHQFHKPVLLTPGVIDIVIVWNRSMFTNICSIKLRNHQQLYFLYPIDI